MNHMVHQIDDSLAAKGMKLPAFLPADSQGATDAFIQAAFVGVDRAVGAKYGLEYAEQFHYIGTDTIGPAASLYEYIQRNAVRA